METKIYAYEFDLETTLGDTIMEKYESLLFLLNAINQKTEINYAIAHPFIANIFEVSRTGFTHASTMINIGGMCYAGQLSYPLIKINFDLFKSQYMAKDELILCSKDGSSIVHFKNWMQKN